MIELFRTGGFMMWPMVLALVALVVAGTRAAHALVNRAPVAEVRSGADAVLFWGGFSAALGVLGTVVGLSQAALAIERAGSVSAALLWSGVRVTLTTTIFGLVILLLAMIIWYGLRTTARRYSGAPAGA